VLDYDPFSGTVRADTAKQLMEFVQKNHLNVTKIIDTHVHAVSRLPYLHRRAPYHLTLFGFRIIFQQEGIFTSIWLTR
jgi:hypothetical protein